MEIEPQKKLLLADRIKESCMKERVEMVFNCFQDYVRFGQVAISLQEERRGYCKGRCPKPTDSFAKARTGVA